MHAFIRWFILQMPERVGAGQAKVRDLILHLDLSPGWKGTKYLGHDLLLSQTYLKGVGLEVKQTGLELVLV